MSETKNPVSDAYVYGFAEAQRQFDQDENTDFINPFAAGTDEWQGFQEGVYTFTQK
jgi:hypothetical protein